MSTKQEQEVEKWRKEARELKKLVKEKDKIINEKLKEISNQNKQFEDKKDNEKAKIIIVQIQNKMMNIYTLLDGCQTRKVINFDFDFDLDLRRTLPSDENMLFFLEECSPDIVILVVSEKGERQLLFFTNYWVKLD